MSQLLVFNRFAQNGSSVLKSDSFCFRCKP